MKPVLFVPETKNRFSPLEGNAPKRPTIVVVIDEHGSAAGIATMEDLVEEIVGGKRRRYGQAHSGNCERAGGAMLLPGGLSISEVEELLGIQFGENAAETVTTIAGLLSHVSGKLPAPGDKIDLQGYQFEVLDANQTKVLSVRIRKQEAAPAAVKSKAKTKA